MTVVDQTASYSKATLFTTHTGTQTHARTNLCSYKTSPYIHKQIKAKAVGLKTVVRSDALKANAVSGRHVNICLYVVNGAL